MSLASRVALRTAAVSASSRSIVGSQSATLRAAQIQLVRTLVDSAPTKQAPPPPVSGAASVSPPITPTVGTTTSATSKSSSVPPPPPLPPPPPHIKPSFWNRFLQRLGRVTLISFVAGSGIFYYVALKDRSPGPQLPFDSTKKNLVVLGTGWGATSLLKSIDTTEYNVIVLSPRNYFLFTPLLPSAAVGTISGRSIIQPIRTITRHKERQVAVIEAEAQDIDPINKTVTFSDTSSIKGQLSTTTIPYDYLVMAVGAETQTFGIPGVQEHAVFMKELHDAERFQGQFIDCVESAAFPGQSPEEVDRLLHAVVVGGGPTGIELSGELHDFLEEDLRAWYPELAGRIRISLIEALPSVLPMFSKELISYTLDTFKTAKIDVLTKTMVQEVKPNSVVVKRPDGSIEEIPCGLVVWAGGNKPRALSANLMKHFADKQTNRRGIAIDDQMRMLGAEEYGIYAIGDCAASSYAPTAQVASQQGAYLARTLKQVAKADQLREKRDALKKAGKPLREVDAVQRQLEKAERIRPFDYSHQGSLAYIGSDKAIADLPIWQRTFSSGGGWTYLFWRSAYLSTLFSLRNRSMVAMDWVKVKLFGRDVSRE